MKMFYKTLFAILFLSLSAGGVSAQEKVSASYEANLKELIQLTAKPTTKRDIDFKKDKGFVKGFFGVYRKYFSEKEIEGLLQFYKTPLGQKLIQAGPDLLPYFAQLDMIPKIVEQDCWDGAERIAKAVRSGINLFRANEIAEGRPDKSPKELDGGKKGFFGAVLNEPITDSSWTKKGNTYTVQCNGKQKSFTYHSESGKFE